MRILLSNKFYYPKGGDCIHAFELEKLLTSNGHEVAFFAMQHRENLLSKYASYFPSEVNYSVRNIRNLSEQVIRPVWSDEVRRKFRLLIEDFKPDIVHVHNIHSQLSPVIVREAWLKKIPVVWTIHDYKLLCPRYDCRRDGKPCELCFKDKKNVIRYRCMKDSLTASLVAYLEAVVWNRRKLSEYTSHFICPSEFIRQKMISGGFNKDKLITINNFYKPGGTEKIHEQKENYYCYVGRLSKEKGVETLLRSATDLPQYHLKIAGTGPLESYFREKYASPNIEYLGHISSGEVQEILSGALFSVMPSECYENNPLAVIESLSLGTPVLGASTGGIPELIEVPNNGYLFESGNIIDLKDKIDFFMINGKQHFDTAKIANDSREKFSEELFYYKLLSVYQLSLHSEDKLTLSKLY